MGTCLSMKSSPQTVLFDAATIFGGIIQEGKPKPGDSLPSNKRDEMKALTEKTRRTVKVRFNNLIFVLNTNHLRLRTGETINDVVVYRGSMHFLSSYVMHRKITLLTVLSVRT